MKTRQDVETFCDEFACSLSMNTVQDSQKRVVTSSIDTYRVSKMIEHQLTEHHGISVHITTEYDMNNHGFILLNNVRFRGLSLITGMETDNG